MKDEQKVWIRGVEGRGSEVIKMLGGENYLLGGDNPGYIYYISHDGEISFVLVESEFGKIIMDNYRELHLPERWKDGDVLINVQFSDIFAVCKSACNARDNAYHCYMYADFGCDEIDAEGCDILRSYYRLATPSEVERFHDLLHKHGKEWDAEKKELVDWRWMPKRGEGYYYFDWGGDVIKLEWEGASDDLDCYHFGNCFRTHEEAKVAAEKVKKLLKGEQGY